jgi:hypothetical protein
MGMMDTKEIPETQESPPPIESEPIGLVGKHSIQGEYSSTTDTQQLKDVWEDKGVIDVPVADLPDPEGVESPQDFDHHITWEDAQSATKQLPEIQDLVKNGKTGDDFSTEDQAAGLDYAHGKRRVYDLYYGSNPVRLDKDGDHYDIVSGRHRIYAAKELGLSTVPARVKEKRISSS